jgi:hypothetical protein
MVYIILFIYNIVVMPLAFILVHIAMLFSGKSVKGSLADTGKIIALPKIRTVR